MIEIRHLSKSYPQYSSSINVFSNLNFKVNSGESVAVLGPSGCGKTTLLQLIAGIQRPDSGSIIFDNIAIESLNDDERRAFRLKNIGLIFQEDRFLPQLTIEENILLPSFEVKNFDTSLAKKLLNKLNLPTIAHRFPHELSGGERQRCAIARAFIMSPSIILADEPTARLDRNNAKIVLSELKRLVSELGVTLIMVTHSEYAANQMQRQVMLESQL